MSYKCGNCGVIKEKGSKVYFINSLESMFPVSMCSEKCAKERIESNIKILENGIYSLKNMELKEEIW